jgi:NAD(P)H-quinone oxidoreductase subunit 5
MSQAFSDSIWLVPFYPLIGAILAVPWSPGIMRRIGPRPAGYLNILMTCIGLLHSLLALRETWHRPLQTFSFTWLQAAGLTITFDGIVSSVTVGALVLVTGLNLLAQIYTIGYLEMDWGWARFYCLLALFEAGICALVLCNSLFFSYVILEILTLGTYLLLGFWFNQSLVVTGARDAFLTKRVGDLFLLMGVVALLPLAGTWNFTELAIWAQTTGINPTVATLLACALIAGPIGKCAQFPLHLWLDEAMESPVPGTILRNTIVVSVGAWVLIKLQPVIALSPFGINAVIWTGAVTAVGASLIAIAQIDIKRVLSYSVSTYMGLIFIAVGTNQIQVALILLLTYAVAMALLVMSTGGIILNNISQDLRQYGGLWSRRPISGLSYLIGAVSLVALPPLGGFWALTEMVNNLWDTYPAMAWVVIAVEALTAFSVTRQFCLVFGGETKPMTVRSPEGLWALVLPMTILAGFALHIPMILAQWDLLPEWSRVTTQATLILVGATALGCGTSAFIYLTNIWRKPIELKPKFVQDFFAYDLYTATIYRFTVVFAVGLVSQLIDWLDRYLVDGIVNLVGLFTVFGGQTLRYNTSGQTNFYALSIILGTTLFVFIVSLPFFLTSGVVMRLPF